MKLKRNFRGRANISKDPDIPKHCRYNSLATESTVTPRIDSKHDGGCDSPVAHGQKAINPFVNPTGSLTLLFQLERRADLHVSTRYEA